MAAILANHHYHALLTTTILRISDYTLEVYLCIVKGNTLPIYNYFH
jgi:hypothetical protein